MKEKDMWILIRSKTTEFIAATHPAALQAVPHQTTGSDDGCSTAAVVGAAAGVGNLHGGGAAGEAARPGRSASPCKGLARPGGNRRRRGRQLRPLCIGFLGGAATIHPEPRADAPSARILVQ